MYHYAEDNKIDLIEREVAELFAEFDVEAYDDVSSVSSFLSYNEASTISEIMKMRVYRIFLLIGITVVQGKVWKISSVNRKYKNF